MFTSGTFSEVAEVDGSGPTIDESGFMSFVDLESGLDTSKPVVTIAVPTPPAVVADATELSTAIRAGAGFNAETVTLSK